MKTNVCSSKENKGFTLIELLAVIVILAIIALIVTPIAMKSINNTKIGALKESAKGLLNSAELYYVQHDKEEIDLLSNVLKYNGKRYSGKVNITNGKLRIHMYGDGYCVTKSTNNEEIIVTRIEEENCDYFTGQEIVSSPDNSSLSETASINLNTKGIKEVSDFRIYGNSTQDGTPTPTEPIEVLSLGERTKNLFDKNTMSERIYAYIDSLGRWLSSNDSYSIRIPCKPNTTYTISENNPNNAVFRAGVCDSEDTPLSPIQLYSVTRYTNDTVPIIVNTGENAKYIIVQIGSATSDINIQTLQIEEGTEATDYISYNAVEVKSSGKNIIDFKEALDYWNVTYTYDSNTNVYNLNNIGNGYTRPYIFSDSMGTYTISGVIEDITSQNTRIGICYYDGTTVTNRTPLFPNETSKTANNVNAFYLDHITNGYRNISNVQLEQGTTATDYEPYIAPTTTTIDLTGHEPLRKIGNVADYIDYANSRIVRNIDKYIFNGTEVWNTTSAGDNYRHYGTININGKLGLGNTTDLLCSHFTAKNYNDTVSGQIGISYRTVSATAFGFQICDTNGTSSNFNNWLAEQYTAGTPVTIYYPLETPVSESITLPTININSDSTHISVIGASKIEAIQ